ncbi:helix-turn-helix domain-containing protein [Methylobacterium oryzihabitans]|uniref:Helix-turn-helix domain-containing protein n=2 Tax=Methylobacterium oryzihabitans TaxID=2499852 RepID=A0A437PDJ5_9HYPH|nr:helix-turn-helix domain-containing protein [Methylobacterium oryzihabitans]
MVENVDAVIHELAGAGIRASRYREPASVGPAELRERLQLTQEQFALAFGLDAATLRNWEQGRSQPDRASRSLLAMIATDPGAVVGLLARAQRDRREEDVGAA